MTPGQYEQLLAEIADGICRAAPDLQSLVLGSGRNNKIEGASGYGHQIDVSLQDPARLFIIECKYWTDRIGVQEVLVLCARTIDIAGRLKGCSITPILVSVKGASAGAVKLARHFGVTIEIAVSASEFGLRIGKFVTQAVTDRVVMSDHCEATVLRNNVEVPP